MGFRRFALDDLRRILREAAGADEAVDLDGDIVDQAFTDLGYDSLALLETASRIEGEVGIVLDDDTVTTALTPRALIDVVNAHISGSAAVA
jgi:act minimal PKS acyl carrier protein